MARTKQTPRNPVMERPSTAMGSDMAGENMERECQPNPHLGKQLKEENNCVNTYYTKHLNNT